MKTLPLNRLRYGRICLNQSQGRADIDVQKENDSVHAAQSEARAEQKADHLGQLRPRRYYRRHVRASHCKFIIGSKRGVVRKGPPFFCC